jgi:hypothetical protein
VLCCADEAVLCWACDDKIHAANKLASKHQRVPLSIFFVGNQYLHLGFCQDHHHHHTFHQLWVLVGSRENQWDYQESKPEKSETSLFTLCSLSLFNFCCKPGKAFGFVPQIPKLARFWAIFSGFSS